MKPFEFFGLRLAALDGFRLVDPALRRTERGYRFSALLITDAGKKLAITVDGADLSEIAENGAQRAYDLLGLEKDW